MEILSQKNPPQKSLSRAHPTTTTLICVLRLPGKRAASLKIPRNIQIIQPAQCKFLLETNLDIIYELGNQEKVSMKSDDDKSSLVCRTFERKNRQFPLEKEGEKK